MAADRVNAMATASRPSRTEIAPAPEELARTYARWLVEAMSLESGPFRMALCGGHTPRPLYHLLGSPDYRARIDWTRLWIFWGDERFVPHDDADSNFRMARELWLDHVPLTQAQIHGIPTDGDLEACAARYAALLQREYGGDSLVPSRPLFDAVLLGVGNDGHTASLLPGTPALDERTRWVTGVPRGAPQPRITLTYPAIASSRFITYLATGADKAGIVARVRAGEHDLPAARVRSDGELIWFLDDAAAGLSKPNP
jgi:6-phosphogluconolactonase